MAGGDAVGDRAERLRTVALSVPEVAITEPIRVVVGEDQPLMREGIVHVLSESGFDVIGVAADAVALVQLAEALLPQVVVTDIQMPPTMADDGLEAARRIRSSHPEIAVLVLSHYLEAQYPLALLSEGAEGVGYLLKDRLAEVSVFADAVRRVAQGGSVLDPEVVRRMVERPRTKGPSRFTYTKGAGGFRSHGRGFLEPGDRGPAGGRCRRRREARDEHLPQAATYPDARGPPSGPCCAVLPPLAGPPSQPLTRSTRRCASRSEVAPEVCGPQFGLWYEADGSVLQRKPLAGGVGVR